MEQFNCIVSKIKQNKAILNLFTLSCFIAIPKPIGRSKTSRKGS